jgi:transglutaminase-like putative cysteine protease
MESNVRQFDVNYKRKRPFQLKKAGIYAKKEKFPLLLFMVGIVMIYGLVYGLGGGKASSKVSGVLPMGVVAQLTSVTGRYVFYDNSMTPAHKDDIWVMYSGLSDEDKNVYNLFLDLVEHRNGEAYSSAVIISDNRLERLGEKHFWDVYSAMRRDHPEYFYLSTDPDIINCTKTSSDGYTVFLYTMKDTDYSEEIKAFDNATREFLSDIDLRASDLEIELQVHDKLIDLVSYDYIDNEKPDETTADPKYTAYGALVCNSEGKPNSAVCSGYSLAFEHILHQAGIPCGYVAGEVISAEPRVNGQLGHAWNIVKIGKKWYEVDVTWDDMDSDLQFDRDIYESIRSDDEKFFNWRHHYFNRTSEEMSDLKASEDTLFELEGYLPYNPVKDTKHKRSTKVSDKASETEVFLNTLMPVAR